MTTTIDGARIARDIRARVAERVAEIAALGRVPGLATILVGDDPASAVYVAAKRRAIREAGMRDFHRHLSRHASGDEVAAVIDELAAEPDVSGILLQLPLPAHLDAAPLTDRIPAAKDVDGLTTASAGGWPAANAGCAPAHRAASSNSSTPRASNSGAHASPSSAGANSSAAP